MASTTSFYAVSVLCLVIIGSLPCKSTECTRDTIDQCHRDNLKMPEECLAYKKYMKCLGDIKPQCTDDKLIEEIELETTSVKRVADECPGFPDGTCYYNVVARDCGEAPYYRIKYAKDEATKKKLCDDLKGKASHIKTCTQGVKAKCTSADVLGYLDDHVADIAKTLKMCAPVAGAESDV